MAKSAQYLTSVLGSTFNFTAPGWTFLSRSAFRVILREYADVLPLA
ncbi:MAG: hypothetical protein H0X14_01600 [Acidobacteria bacterium]|nr:hypothetical protein [Acidobacteriota bacterium]